jgi:hypothetical protein
MPSVRLSVGPWQWTWRVGQVLMEHWRFAWWGAVANLILRVHPAVTCHGWVTVSGPGAWRLDPRGRLNIGKNVRLHSGSWINPVGGQGPLIIAVGPGGNLTLEDGCGISSSTIVCRHHIRVGAGAMIGGGCELIDSDFHSISARERMAPGNMGVRSSPIEIGERAFIGARVLVIKGARVGVESIVGAGSVVTGRVADGECWVGNPARPIRRNAT